MKVSIFVQDENGTLGFLTEDNHCTFECTFTEHLRDVAHQIELPEDKVEELKKAFKAYAKAQEEIQGWLDAIRSGKCQLDDDLKTFILNNSSANR